MTHIPRQLVFSQEEYRRRLAAVQSGMAGRGLDALLLYSPEHIFYLTGYQTFGLFTYLAALVPSRGAPVLILRYLESFLAKLYAWVPEVEIWDDHEDPVDVTVRVLRERELAGRRRIGTEDRVLAYDLRRRLAQALPDATLDDGTGLVEQVRIRKSPEEIAYMRKASEYSTVGMAAGIRECTAGRTENDVAAAVFDAMTRAGSEYSPHDPIVTSGWRSGVPHSTYERRRLEPQDTVLLEITGTHYRYVAPLMRTAVIGTPTPKVREMAALVLEGLQAAIETIRPGVTAGEVDDACRGVMERAGWYEGFRKRTGYSVGFGFPPSWNEGHIISLRKGERAVLAPAMVYHVPVTLRDYGVSTVGLSETILVTETGREVLTKFARELLAGGA
jgi:Xaa-Pro dipeptidase